MDHLNTDILKERIRKLNEAAAPTTSQSVLYVMSRDARADDNFALIAAQRHALALELPLVVLFIAYDKPVANRAQEHVTFLLEGLRDVKTALEAHNIAFVLRTGTFKQELDYTCKVIQPSAVYFDFSPLKGPMATKREFAEQARFPVYEVDTHNAVPAWVITNKQEIGARTLRPKLHHHLPRFVNQLAVLEKQPYALKPAILSCPIDEALQIIAPLYSSNGTDISRFKPGQQAAKIALNEFITVRLKGYAVGRNDPLANQQSELSPYLHYGQLSSLAVARAVYDAVRTDSRLQPDADALIEEMLVRKELADNFCLHNQHYLELAGAPQWAQASLAKHADDPREFVYSLQQFEAAETHDPAWNAAQLQLRREGKMHGYMRMYWAKKVLEWSNSPEEALQYLIYLNDFYHIDGYDPNGYVGILWSIAGLHDRPWGERPVYGVVRSMVYNGLKRKFDIQKYIDNFS